jgi:hypothetical protein
MIWSWLFYKLQTDYKYEADSTFVQPKNTAIFSQIAILQYEYCPEILRNYFLKEINILANKPKCLTSASTFCWIQKKTQFHATEQIDFCCLALQLKWVSRTIAQAINHTPKI